MDIKYQSFIKTINNVSQIDEIILKDIYAQFIYSEMKKNQYFVFKGSISKSFAFVAEGLFKVSFINENGDEYIKYFLTQSDVLLGNLMENEISNVSIQALKNSVIFKIDYKALISLTEKYHPLKKMRTTLVNQYLTRKEKREIELLSNNAKRNYELFMEQYAHCEKDLSQYHIAQYLGITPTQLSRIKKRISQHM